MVPPLDLMDPQAEGVMVAMAMEAMVVRHQVAEGNMARLPGVEATGAHRQMVEAGEDMADAVDTPGLVVAARPRQDTAMISQDHTVVTCVGLLDLRATTATPLRPA